MSPPHLLYLAFFYPPSRASGVYRAIATTRAFVEAGWRVTVLTTTERFFSEEIGSVDESLLELIPDGVEVGRVPFSFRSVQQQRSVREMSRLNGNFPKLVNSVRRQTARARSYWHAVRGHSELSYQMEDRYVGWIEPVVARARHIHGVHRIDHVLATGNPYSSFEAARIIASLIGVEFAIDYRDPWAFDLRTGTKARRTPGTEAAEKRIVDESSACIHVNEAIANAYRALFPNAAGRQHVVLNGYDRECIPSVNDTYKGGALMFGMLGTVTDLWPLVPIFEAWRQLKDDLPPESLLRLAGHLGYFPWSADSLRASLPGGEIGFRYDGPIAKLEVAQFYGSLHVVVVALFGGPMVTAGKVFEVAAVGKPIVCVQPIGGGARQMLQAHPLAFVAEPEPDSIAEAFRAAAELAATMSPDQSYEVRRSMEPFERQTAMRRMVEIISESAHAGVADWGK